MALTRENIQDYKGVYDIFKTDSNAVLNHPQKDQLLQLVQEYEGYLTQTEQARQDSIAQSQFNLDQVTGIQQDTGGIIPKLMGDPDLVRSEPETEVTTNDVLDKQKQTALTPPGQKLSLIHI